jgi:hypothetical protein
VICLLSASCAIAVRAAKGKDRARSAQAAMDQRDQK